MSLKGSLAKSDFFKKEQEKEDPEDVFKRRSLPPQNELLPKKANIRHRAINIPESYVPWYRNYVGVQSRSQSTTQSTSSDFPESPILPDSQDDEYNFLLDEDTIKTVAPVPKIKSIK